MFAAVIAGLLLGLADTSSAACAGSADDQALTRTTTDRMLFVPNPSETSAPGAEPKLQGCALFRVSVSPEGRVVSDTPLLSAGDEGIIDAAGKIARTTRFHRAKDTWEGRILIHLESPPP